MVRHVLAYQPKVEEITQMYTVILRKFLNEFELLNNKKEISVLAFDEFMKQNEKLNLENQQVNLGYNLYNYLSSVKKGVSSSTALRSLHITNGLDAVKYAKLLSRKRIIDILKNINEEKNATQLAKELKIARSNMSNYLKLLEKHDLISVDENGAIRRKTASITTNFEVGLQQLLSESCV